MVPNQIEPHWQPIQRLPLFASMIERQLETNQEHYRLYLKVQERLRVLDETTLRWAEDVYRTQLEDVAVYRAQFVRWRAGVLNAAQQEELADLSADLATLQDLAKRILALLETIRQGEGEAMLSRSRVEL